MAGPFAHFAVTNKAIEKTLASPKLAKSGTVIFGDFKNFIITGAISPDMPCFYDNDQRTREAKIWTHRMHNVNTRQTILSGLKYLKEHKEDLQSTSWFLGYIAHIVGDIVTHPVVNATIGPFHNLSEDNRATHRLCEITQCKYIYEHLEGDKISTFSEKELSEILEMTQPLWEIMLKGAFVNYDDLPAEITKWQENYKDLMSRAEFKPYDFSAYIYHLLEKTSIDNRTESEKRSDMEIYVEKLPYPKANCLKQSYDPKRPVKYTDMYFRSIDLISEHWVNILDDLENDTGWTGENFQNVSLDTGALIGEFPDVPALLWPA